MPVDSRRFTPEDERYLAAYDPGKYERLSVAVDLVVMTIQDDALKVLTVRRDEPPFRGLRALPGVFVGPRESLDAAVQRCLREETGLQDIYFEQLYTWGAVERDPRTRVVAVSYLALVPSQKLPPERLSPAAALTELEPLLADGAELAFDHREILRLARQRVAGKAEYTPIAFELVPPEFVLSELQRVFEILLGRPLYKANFRKKIAPLVEETGRSTAGAANRPSRYYRLK